MYKIALLADQFFNPSGVGTYTRELIKNLVNKRYLGNNMIRYKILVSIENYDKKEELKVYDELDWCEVFWLPSRSLLFSSWHFFYFPNVESIISDFDLIHVLSGSVRIPTKKPCIVTIHDLASERRPQDYPWRRRWFKNKLLKELQKNKNPLIAVSETTKIDLMKLFDFSDSEIYVTLEAVDNQIFNNNFKEDQIPVVKDKYNLPQEFFLFLGILSPRKNVTLLLKAYDLFVKSNPNPPYLIVAGPALSWKDKEIYQVLSSLECRNLVKFIGFVDEKNLPTIYSMALALVYPSLYEGFGLPILEAMACGCPVICSNSTSLPEVGGDAPIYISGKNDLELAEVLEKVQNDFILRTKLKENGLERVKKFSWETCAKQTLDIYERILKP